MIKFAKRRSCSTITAAGFTLVELLVVIAIIAILIALAVPAIQQAMNSAKKGQAATEVKSLEGAILAYFNQYGRFPHGNNPGGQDYFYGPELTDNRELLNVLRAVDGEGNTGHEMNPRRVPFLQIPERALTEDGDYVDPWLQPYFIYVDASFDNEISGGPHYSSITNRKVAVWSAGTRDPEPADYENARRHVHSWPYSE